MEARFPRLVKEQVFKGIDAFMVICEPEEDALFLRDTTWFIRTPADKDFGSLTIYFTYAPGQICLEALDADEDDPL